MLDTTSNKRHYANCQKNLRNILLKKLEESHGKLNKNVENIYDELIKPLPG